MPPLDTLLDEAAQAQRVLDRKRFRRCHRCVSCSRRCAAASSIRTTIGSRRTSSPALLRPRRGSTSTATISPARLTNALRLSYPAVRRLVGAEFFAGMAAQYIAAHPPRSACLNDYGGAFATFLAGFLPAAGLAYLPGVARLEWAVNRALHAPSAVALNVAALAGIDPQDHGRSASRRIRPSAWCVTTRRST